MPPIWGWCLPPAREKDAPAAPLGKTGEGGQQRVGVDEGGDPTTIAAQPLRSAREERLGNERGAAGKGMGGNAG